MVKLVLAVLAILFAPAAAKAQSHSATLKWTASTDSTQTGASVNVYRSTGACPAAGTTPSGFTVLASKITAVTYVDTTVGIGQFSYYVTEVVGTQESAPSNCVSTSILPASPTALTLTAQ